jgi:hypothetical protein
VLLAMSAGLIRGVGFVPRHLVWRLLFSGWACAAALALALPQVPALMLVPSVHPRAAGEPGLIRLQRPSPASAAGTTTPFIRLKHRTRKPHRATLPPPPRSPPLILALPLAGHAAPYVTGSPMPAFSLEDQHGKR